MNKALVKDLRNLPTADTAATPTTDALNGRVGSSKRTKPVRPSLPVIRCPHCDTEIQNKLAKYYFIELLTIGKQLTRKLRQLKRRNLADGQT
jgi:hypothetical protein